MAVDLATLAIRVESLEAKVAQQRLDDLTRSGQGAEKSVGALTTASGGLVSALAKIAAAAGGIYAIERAFVSGIKAVDDFRVSVIGIAATLTDMSKSGQGSMESVFARNKAAAEDMYKAITLEAAKHFSSASEGMMVYNRLVQSGYAVQKNEVADLLLLTDKIKLATKGQNVEMQLNTELIALMSGQAKAQSMIAMELQARLGSGWGDLVKKHREAGDLLKWIASLFPGLVTANKEIEGTLNAQWATTKSLLDLLAIGGLAGAYDDIVNLVKQINEQLRNSEGLVHAIARAWEGVRDIAKATWGFISEIYNVVSKSITWTINISTNILGPGAAYLSSGGVPTMKGATVGTGGGITPTGVGSTSFGDVFGALYPDVAKRKISNPWETGQLAARGVSAFIPGANGELIPVFGTEGMVGMPPIATTPRTAQDKGGGGKGTDAAESAMRSFIETMRSETARAAGDTEAILGAWYGKQLVSIEKWKNAGLDTTEALAAADAAYYSKLEKLNSDFTDWYNTGLGNQYEKLVAEETKKLATVAGNKAKEAQVIEVYDRKHFELSQQMETERINLFKGYLDTMAGLSPILADQLGYKREALALELKLADAALERSRREGKITQDTYEQAQAMQAVVAQAKKYNLEMENDKGIRGWAFGRAKEAEGRNTIKDMIGGLESGFQSAFSSGLQGVLTQEKKTLTNVGKTMFMGFIGELHKGATTKLFDSAAKMLRPEAPAGTGELKTAAKGLQTASEGFNLNTAQFGLAAGGLLLSGIGIATNSQALVYAGAVLQVAGLAIQLYEALTATTTVATMTMAAGELTGSSVALSFSATMLTSAASALVGAAGASSGGSILGGIAKAIPVVGSFFHSGGPIYAHAGWPRLASDEVPIIAQTGERVLSRSQNRDYEAGMPDGQNKNGVTIHAPITFAPTYNYRPTQQDMNRDAKMMAKALKRELGNQLSG